MIGMVRAVVCVMLCGVLESLPHSVVRASGGAVMRGCDSVVRFEKESGPTSGIADGVLSHGGDASRVVAKAMRWWQARGAKNMPLV